MLVYDSKDDDEAMIPNAAVARSADEAIRAIPGRVVYRPNRDELRSMQTIAAAFDRILDKILRTGGRHGVLIHEIGDLADERVIGNVLSEIYRKGRSLYVPVIACTQRPVGIPRLAVETCDHAFVFWLMDDRAREACVPFAGPSARAGATRDFSFLHRGPQDVDCHRLAPLARGGSRKVNTAATV